MQSKTILIFATGVTALDFEEVGHAVTEQTLGGTTFLAWLDPEWQYLSPFLQDMLTDMWRPSFDPFTLNELVIEVST